jgi:hypothetical protein
MRTLGTPITNLLASGRRVEPVAIIAMYVGASRSTSPTATSTRTGTRPGS